MAYILRQTLPGSLQKGILTLTDQFTGAHIGSSDLRQCCHCQKVWEYKPGSKAQRGFCMKCNGHVCGSPGCWNCYPAEQRIDDTEAIYYRNKKMIEAAVRQ